MSKSRRTGRPNGRPSEYSTARAETLCARIATGRMLSSVCQDDGMPHVATVYRWMEAHAEFRDMFARAKDVQIDVIAADTLRIADEILEGTKRKRKVDAKGIESTQEQTGDMVERARLMVDTRKWLLAKLAPRKYGDRIELANDPDSPLPAPKIIVEFLGRRELPTLPALPVDVSRET